MDGKLTAWRKKGVSFADFIRLGKEIDATLNEHPFSDENPDKLAETMYPYDYELRRTLYRDQKAA